jgi:hypothetical protein
VVPTSAPTPTPTPSTPCSPPDPVASLLRHKWSITKFVWKALCGALLPIRFEHIQKFVSEVLAHLVRHDPHRNRQSATERCLRLWAEDPGDASN